MAPLLCMDLRSCGPKIMMFLALPATSVYEAMERVADGHTRWGERAITILMDESTHALRNRLLARFCDQICQRVMFSLAHVWE